MSQVYNFVLDQSAFKLFMQFGFSRWCAIQKHFLGYSSHNHITRVNNGLFVPGEDGKHLHEQRQLELWLSDIFCEDQHRYSINISQESSLLDCDSSQIGHQKHKQRSREWRTCQRRTTRQFSGSVTLQHTGSWTQSFSPVLTVKEWTKENKLGTLFCCNENFPRPYRCNQFCWHLWVGSRQTYYLLLESELTYQSATYFHFA